MAMNLGKAVAYLDVDTSKFKTGLKSAVSDLKDFTNKANDSGTRVKGLTGALNTVGGTMTKYVTTPLLGVGTAAVKTAFDFEKQMARVKSISGATGDDFKALQDKAKEMGATTIFTSLDAANAMEYMGMAGWKADQMIAGLPGIMDLAAASGEDLGSVSDIVTDALTAFGLKAEDTGHFVDVLASAATNSNTNVAMLGESFKYAAPVAGALGYSIEDVGVALGLMANSGIKASQGGTALRALFTNLAKPTGESAKAVEALDLSLTKSDGSMKSFKEIMDELRMKFGELKMPQQEVTKKMEELDQALADGTLTQDEYNEAVETLTKNAFGAADAEKAKYAAMLAGRTGMSGLLAILNTTTEDYDKLTDAIYNCDGAAKDMADTQRDTLWGSFELLKSAISAVFQSIGERLIPYIQKLTDWLTKLVDKFNGLSDKQKDFVVKIGLIVAAIGPALLIFAKLINAMVSIGNAFKTVGMVVTNAAGLFGKAGGIFSSVGGVIGKVATFLGTAFMAHPIIAAITAIIAIIAALWIKCKGFKGFVEDLVGFFTGIPKKIVGFFTDLPGNIAKIFENIVGGVKDKLGGLVKGIDDKLYEANDTFTRWWNGQQEIINVDKIWVPIDNMTDKIKGKYDELAEKSTGALKVGYENMGKLAKSGGETVSASLSLVNDLFFNSGQIVADVFTLQFDQIPDHWKRLVDIFKIDVDTLKQWGSQAIEDAKAAFGAFNEHLNTTFKDKVGGVFKDMKEKVITSMTDVEKKLYETGQNIGGKTGEMISNLSFLVRNVKLFIVDGLEGVKDFVLDVGKLLIDLVTFNWGEIGEDVKTLFGNIVKNGKELFEDLKGTFSSIGETIKETGGVILEKLGLDKVLEGVGEFRENLNQKLDDAVVGAFDPIVTKIDQYGEDWRDRFYIAGDKMGGGLGEGLKGVGDTVNGATTIAQGGLQIVADSVNGIGGALINLVTLNPSGAFDELKMMFQRFKSRDLETLKEGFEEVKKGATRALDGLKMAAKEKLDGVKEKIKGVFGKGGDDEESTGIFSKITGKFDELKKNSTPSLDDVKKKLNETFGIGDELKDVTTLDQLIDKSNELGIPLKDIVAQMKQEMMPTFDSIFGVNIPELFTGFQTKASDVFGEVTGFFQKSPEEMGETLGIMAGNFVNFVTDLGTNIGDFFANSGENLTTFFTETIPEKWGEFTEWLSGGIEGVLGDIGGFISDAWDNVVEFFTGIPEKLGEFFGSLDEIYDNFLEWTGEVSAKLGEWLGEMVGHIFLFFTQDIPEAIGKFFTETVPSFLSNLQEFVVKIGDKLTEFSIKLWDNITKWWDNLWKSFGEWKQKAGEKAKEIIDNIVKYVKELPGNIKKNIGEAWTHFKEWGGNMISKAKEVGKNVTSNIVDKVKEMPGKFKSKVDSVYTKCTEWGIKMALKAKEVGKKFNEDFLKFIKELPGKVVGFIKSIPEKIGNLKDVFLKAGKKILSGLWDGLKGVWDSISKWLDSIWTNLGKFTEGFKKGFDKTVNSRANEAARSVDGSHAGGLSYVPFDGYRAELHKGERVLTAEENEQYNNGSRNNGGGDTFVFYNTQPEPYEYYRQMKKAKQELAYGF